MVQAGLVMTARVPGPKRIAARKTPPGPHRSASRPTRGPTAPCRNKESAATVDNETRSQPNSSSIGLMKTPKDARMPDPNIKTTVTAATTTQA